MEVSIVVEGNDVTVATSILIASDQVDRLEEAIARWRAADYVADEWGTRRL